MNEKTLIFTERGLLPNVIDSALTVIAWLGFGSLIYQGVILPLSDQFAVTSEEIAISFGMMLIFLAVAILNCLLLIMWDMYNHLRFGNRYSYRPLHFISRELVEIMNIKPYILTRLYKAQRITIHHNPDGDIIAVD